MAAAAPKLALSWKQASTEPNPGPQRSKHGGAGGSSGNRAHKSASKKHRSSRSSRRKGGKEHGVAVPVPASFSPPPEEVAVPAPVGSPARHSNQVPTNQQLYSSVMQGSDEKQTSVGSSEQQQHWHSNGNGAVSASAPRRVNTAPVASLSHPKVAKSYAGTYRTGPGRRSETPTGGTGDAVEIAVIDVQEERAPRLDKVSIVALHNVLLEGEDFLKYGRRGKPHYKTVRCDRKGLLWWTTISAGAQASKTKSSCIHLNEMTSVIRGKHSKVFRRVVSRSAPEDHCFSIVTDKRTLDLQTSSTRMRDLWVEALISASVHIKNGWMLDEAPPATDADAMEESVAGHDDDDDESLIDYSYTESISYSLNEPKEVPLTAEEKDMILYLDDGEDVVKHGRKGKPKKRHLHVAKGKVFWQAPAKRFMSDPPPAGFLKLVHVLQVVPGKQTKVFARSAASQADEDCCLSIITQERTLDIECKDTDTRDKWVDALLFASRKAREIRNRKWLAKQRLQNEQNMTWTDDDVDRHAKAERQHRNQALQAGGAAKSSTWNATTLSQMSRQFADEKKQMALHPMSDFELIKQQLREDAAKNTLTPQQLRHLAILDQGACMIKHGRRGKPKPKWINCSQGKIFWAPERFGRTAPESSVSTYVLCVDVKNVVPGKITPVFGRSSAKSAPPDRCFSVITSDRSLDLQAPSTGVRDFWINALHFAVQRTKAISKSPRQSLAIPQGTQKSHKEFWNTVLTPLCC